MVGIISLAGGTTFSPLEDLFLPVRGREICPPSRQEIASSKLSLVFTGGEAHFFSEKRRKGEKRGVPVAVLNKKEGFLPWTKNRFRIRQKMEVDFSLGKKEIRREKTYSVKSGVKLDQEDVTRL